VHAQLLGHNGCVNIVSLRRPPIDLVALESEHVSFKGPLSTKGVAGVDDDGPHGFNTDAASVTVGHGAESFARAQLALADWAMFSMPWIELTPREPRVELGRIVVVTVRILGLVTVVNANRITRLVDHVDEHRHRWGFVYATLHHHAQRGEEIFLVTHHLADDRIEYALLAHSRPEHWLAWIAYPLTRWYQRRFRRQSCTAMRRAITPEPHDAP